MRAQVGTPGGSASHSPMAATAAWFPESLSLSPHQQREKGALPFLDPRAAVDRACPKATVMEGRWAPMEVCHFVSPGSRSFRVTRRPWRQLGGAWEQRTPRWVPVAQEDCFAIFESCGGWVGRGCWRQGAVPCGKITAVSLSRFNR